MQNYFVKEAKGIQQSFYLIYHGCNYNVVYLKNHNVTWQGSHEVSMKLMTMTKVSKLTLDPWKMFDVMNPIYGKVVGCQKNLWFEKGGQFSSSLSLVFHFEFL
jgi:hypothetical protein